VSETPDPSIAYQLTKVIARARFGRS
jgi:hypothetical protein